MTSVLGSMHFLAKVKCIVGSQDQATADAHLIKQMEHVEFRETWRAPDRLRTLNWNRTCLIMFPERTRKDRGACMLTHGKSQTKDVKLPVPKKAFLECVEMIKRNLVIGNHVFFIGRRSQSATITNNSRSSVT